MPYSEQDPLLPKDNKSPEIHGSRPSSISDIGSDQADTSEEDDGLRRTFPGYAVQIVLVLLILSTFSLLIFNNLSDSFPGNVPDKQPIPRTIDERVSRILTDTPLIDGHNDLAILVRFLYDNHIYEEKFTKPFEEGGMPMHVDLPRLKKGKNGGAFWSAFVPCPPTNGNEKYPDPVEFTLSQLDLLSRLHQAYPTRFSPPPNSTTALAYFRTGHLISPYAIEGLHQIGNKISNLRNFHSLGVRYATLTHNCHNAYADAALVELPNGTVSKSQPRWGGVSPAGRLVIQEMNRLGMIVDLAHVSQDTMRDVLGGSGDWEGSAAPIIYSHSSAYALCPHPRNVPDDILLMVKEKRGVVMVNFAPDFVSCVANSSNPTGIPDFYPKNSTLQHVVRHIVHIGTLIGYDHVGLGSDFDGIPTTPTGLDDVSKFPDLVAEMLKMGVSDEDAGKVVGGNVLRVWAEVDAVAAKMQKEGVIPVEDELPSFRFNENFAE